MKWKWGGINLHHILYPARPCVHVCLSCIAFIPCNLARLLVELSALMCCACTLPKLNFVHLLKQKQHAHWHIVLCMGLQGTWKPSFQTWHALQILDSEKIHRMRPAKAKIHTRPFLKIEEEKQRQQQQPQPQKKKQGDEDVFFLNTSVPSCCKYMRTVPSTGVGRCSKTKHRRGIPVTS